MKNAGSIFNRDDPFVVGHPPRRKQTALEFSFPLLPVAEILTN
jgi:hypothetical protein